MVQMNAISLTGKVSLVTGASGGIGRVVAESFAAAGSRVAIGYRNHEQEARDLLSICGSNAMIVQGDLSDPAQCRHIVDLVIKQYGRIDILVNNAAIGMVDSFEMPYEAWQTQWNATLNANLMSAVNMTFCSVPHMKNTGGGKIINISSRSAFRGETEYMAYAASKAGMINYTRYLACYYGKQGVRANCISPGGYFNDQPPSFVNEYTRRVPVGRMLANEDIQGAVVFLASDASSYITGMNLLVDGGWTCL